VYTLTYDRRIEKDLRPIPTPVRRLILHRVEQLAIQPRHPQVEKLKKCLALFVREKVPGTFLGLT